MRVDHLTRYAYTQPVSLSHHLAVLEPLSDERQQLLTFDWKVEAPNLHPTLTVHESDGISECSYSDTYQNKVRWFSIPYAHQILNVHVRSQLRIQTPLWPDADQTVACAYAAQQLRYQPGRPWQIAQTFVHPSPFIPRLTDIKHWAATSLQPQRPVLASALELMQRIYAEFIYRSQSTSIYTPLQQVFTQRQGVCQDFAHILIAGLRSHGLAARYVSGYLLTHPPAGQMRLIGADASHAWVQLWCPLLEGGGLWIDLDPTNCTLAADAHIRLAVGRDFGDVTPIKGVIRGGGEHQLQVAVTVQPGFEAIAGIDCA